MLGKSLTLRLAATSIVWVAATLIAAGVLLTFLFRDHIERRFDAMLVGYLEELVAAGEITDAGSLALDWVPVDPRFNRPHSGWYWQIFADGELVASSESAWQARLAADAPAAGRAVRRLVGPAGRPLRALVQGITFPESDVRYTVVVAGPTADIADDVTEFAGKLAITLAVLGIGLLAAVLIQVRFGLAPLRAMRSALTDIRAGRASRLPETFPAEVEPVARELNALLDHNAALLDRARTQAGNLAHGIKNALTVIGNEARGVEGERGRILRDQAGVLAKGLDRYLSRARAGGGDGGLGARAPLKEVVDDLQFSLALLFKDRGVAIDSEGVDGLSFRGDRQDLEEMLGNLMDNACKWAASRVAVRAERRGERLIIAVDDDGPGLSDSERVAVLERGSRLDETKPGSGLGLDIVRDLAELYRGSIDLGRSPLGGLRARLELPAAG